MAGNHSGCGRIAGPSRRPDRCRDGQGGRWHRPEPIPHLDFGCLPSKAPLGVGRRYAPPTPTEQLRCSLLRTYDRHCHVSGRRDASDDLHANRLIDHACARCANSAVTDGRMRRPFCASESPFVFVSPQRFACALKRAGIHETCIAHDETNRIAMMRRRLRLIYERLRGSRDGIPPFAVLVTGRPPHSGVRAAPASERKARNTHPPGPGSLLPNPVSMPADCALFCSRLSRSRERSRSRRG